MNLNFKNILLSENLLLADGSGDVGRDEHAVLYLSRSLLFFFLWTHFFKGLGIEDFLKKDFMNLEHSNQYNKMC